MTFCHHTQCYVTVHTEIQYQQQHKMFFLEGLMSTCPRRSKLFCLTVLCRKLATMLVPLRVLNAICLMSVEVP